MYFTVCIYHLRHFHSLCKFNITSGLIFLHPEELLIFPVVQVFWQQILSNFVCRKKVLVNLDIELQRILLFHFVCLNPLQVSFSVSFSSFSNEKSVIILIVLFCVHLNLFHFFEGLKSCAAFAQYLNTAPYVLNPVFQVFNSGRVNLVPFIALWCNMEGLSGGF